MLNEIKVSLIDLDSAIPETRRTPTKEDMRSPKFSPYFSLGILPKIITFLVTRVNKTWQLKKRLVLVPKNVKSHYFFFFFFFLLFLI